VQEYKLEYKKYHTAEINITHQLNQLTI